MGKNLNLGPFMPFPQHLLNEKDQTILSVEESVIIQTKKDTATNEKQH